MSQDSFTPSGEQAGSGGAAVPRRTSSDHFEMNRQWTERTEEERAEEAAILYEKAVRQRMPSPEIPEQADPEELEAKSQELKLRQLCKDIAAQVMVEELEDSEEEEE